MKKFLVVFLLGLLIAGSAFAQWGNSGYNQTAQTLQTISGTLQMINGMLAIVSPPNGVYYVPNLMPYYGANGLFVNAFVTVYGAIANNYCSPYSFVAGGKWYILPECNNNVPPVQPTYGPPIMVLVVPMYISPPNWYPRYYGW